MSDSENALLYGWGRTAATRARVRKPQHAAAISDAIATAGPRGVIARGLGRSYGDPAQNAGGVVLDMTDLHGLDLDSDLGTALVGAGTSIDAVMRNTTPAGWWVPVTAGTRQVTIGGAIAADIHGKNHHVDGSFGNHVRRITLARPDGVTEELVPGDELFNATVGGMGLTGVIIDAEIELLPITSNLVRVDTDRFDNLESLMAEMVAGDSRYRYSVAWIDAGTRSAAGRGVLSRGDHASADDIAGKQRGLNFEPRQRIDVPALVPNGLLNGTTINAFNEVWFRKAPRHRRDELVSLGTFFHPLDGVSNWNRMYGRAGFVQYQFVVPDTASHLIEDSLEALRAIGATSFLSVLKRFGPASTGLLSFPQPGWTLALDIPAAVSGLAGVLTGLDEQVAAVGGRIYLAKDSRMSPAMFATMYPNHTKFREIRERIDPNHHMNSDLARRLQL